MSSYTVKTNINNHPETSFLQLIDDLVARGGVVNLATDFIASEKAAGADLSVDISIGRMYLVRNSLARPVWSNAIENVVINSNSSGNPRITTLVKRVDLTSVPASDGQGADIVDVIAVDGTPAASPVAPSTATIEAALGTSDPYEIICDVLVADGATAIQDADITDRRRKVVMRTPRAINPVDYVASFTPNFNDGAEQEMTLEGNVTINTPTNMEVGDRLTLMLPQDVTGSRSITWSVTGLVWMSADTSNNTTASKRTTYVLIKVSDSVFEGYLGGKQYS